MSELLAKSRFGDRELPLLRHTTDVMDAAETMFGPAAAPNRLGKAWLRFFRIPMEEWASFHANLLGASAFHDWGKANDRMQDVLNRRGGEQVIRHEHLSAMLLAHEGVTAWLRPRQDVDWDIVLSAVVTHHLKAGFKDLADDAPPVGGGSQFRLLDDHPEFAELVRVISDRLCLATTPPAFPRPSLWNFKDAAGTVSVIAKRTELRGRLRKLVEALRKPGHEPELRRRMLWAVRSALIAADAAASGLPRVGEDIRPWITEKLVNTPLCDAAFIEEISDKRVQQLKALNKWGKWTDFQLRCDYLADRALLLAPCGSGKTLAAWRWIAAWVAKLSTAGRPVSRVIFLYPTRATAKEGFRDYVSWAPEADAALMHGTADYDLKGMFSSEEKDPRYGLNYQTDRRLYALRFWTRRVFSATVDQFLAFLQYAYGPLCLLPLLADSVIVIDEVHSFDRSMFSALKGFLTTFDVPVLCMTATLPKNRRDELERCKLEVCDEKPGELKAIAEASRYRLQRTTQAEAEERIHGAIREGKRVLWVVNQVKRAQQAARTMACDFKPWDRSQTTLHPAPDVPLFCYHSRFRLKDRVGRHNAVVEAFRADSPPALAITTQVCEMSLDMDADLLVTEDCPITSLIQRMGRCNRAREPRADAGEVLIYTPLGEDGKPDLAPYDAEALTGLDSFLTTLSDKESLNQVDLETALNQAPATPPRGDKDSNFLTSGPYASGGEEDFRDIEEFSTRAVLRGDVDELAQLQNEKKPTDGLVVPVPRRLARRGEEGDSRLPSYLAVADDAHYHAAVGFCDKSLTAEGGKAP
jgi:CRISPR-associated endonuclease/helicase Cas3